MCAGAVEKSAGCYELVVEMHSKLGNFLECAMAYKDAGSMFEKADRPNGALPAPSLRPALRWAHGLGCRAAECCRCLDEAKGLYAQEGRLSECAKLAKRRAEIFEKAEIIDLMLECYEEAAELFDGEDQKGETRNCKLKIAHYKALMEQKEAIVAAIEIYEAVGAESLESNLLKWSVKQYYLKALLCALVLAGNQLGKTVDDVREKRSEYCSLDPTFEETREDNLIVGCLDAIDEGDMELFATACNEFDEITKLDSWQTTLLLRAKNVRPPAPFPRTRYASSAARLTRLGAAGNREPGRRRRGRRRRYLLSRSAVFCVIVRCLMNAFGNEATPFVC